MKFARKYQAPEFKAQHAAATNGLPDSNLTFQRRHERRPRSQTSKAVQKELPKTPQSHWKLPAGAMLYTVAICLLVAMLLSGMILLSSYAKLSSDLIYFKELAQSNLQSGKNLKLYGTNPEFGTFSGRLFDSEIDSYYVDMRPWGMYGILHATGVHGPARAEQSTLFGEVPQDAFQASLYLEDRNRPLNLAGKTYLQGLAYLPEAGLKRGMVGKTGFSGNKLHEGAEKLSKQHRCEVDYKWLEDVKIRLGDIQKRGAAGNWKPRSGDSLSQAWRQPVLELRSSYPIALGDVFLGGNIIVTAPVVIIKQEARLQDILVFAQRIHVESGFEGRLQLFSTDSIVLESECRLRYPSTAFLASDDELGAILLEEGSELEGLVMTGADLLDDHAKSESYVRIAEDAEVVGTVIVPENLDLHGTVTGTVKTGKFRLLTGGGVYDNMLMDATIQHDGISPQYAMPLLQAGHPQFMEILDLTDQ